MSSRLFLVRYEDREVFVNSADGPLLGLTGRCYMRVRRLAETYRFCTWESERGDLISAHFSFNDDFFALKEGPDTLRGDTKWLSFEAGAEGLASIDLWWVAVTGDALDADEPENEEDDHDAT